MLVSWDKTTKHWTPLTFIVFKMYSFFTYEKERYKTLDPTDFHCMDKSYFENIFFNNKILDPIDFHCTTKTKQKQNFFKTIFFCFPHEKEGYETCQ